LGSKKGEREDAMLFAARNAQIYDKKLPERVAQQTHRVDWGGDTKAYSRSNNPKVLLNI